MQFLRYQVRFQFTVHCNASEAERTKRENLRARLTNTAIDLDRVFRSSYKEDFFSLRGQIREKYLNRPRNYHHILNSMIRSD